MYRDADALRQKIHRYLDKSGECWVWTRARDDRGYGYVNLRLLDGTPRTRPAYRVLYQLTVGPVPEGLELDHLCRNPSCCRPDHLEPVTHAENVRRGDAGIAGALKTHCPQGHPYSGANLKVSTRGDGRQFRTCRTCAAAWSGKRSAERRLRHPDEWRCPRCARLFSMPAHLGRHLRRSGHGRFEDVLVAA